MATLTGYARRFAFPLWRWYLAGFFALAATNLITLEIPQLAKQVVNGFAGSRELAEYSDIALLIMGLGCLQILVRALSRVFIFWPARSIEAGLKNHLFDRLLKVSYQFFTARPVGEIVSRISNDINHIRVFYGFCMLQVLNLAFLSVLTVGKMASVHSRLTLFCLIPLVSMVVITKFAMPLMHKYSRKNQEAIGRLTHRVTEGFVNIHVVKANAAEKSFLERADVENASVYESNMKLILVRTLLFPFMTCLSGIAQLVVLIYGGQQVISGQLTVGDILAFNIYIGLLIFPLTAIGIIIGVFQRARAALERISEIEDAELEQQSEVHVEQWTGEGQLPGHPMLEVRHLNFRYPGSDADSAVEVLSEVNFSIQPGERIGIYGRVGSGKSTLLNLLTRLYDPPPGSIFLKGKDILTIPPAELRRQVLFAQQTVHLFSSSILENLQLGMGDSAGALATAREAARKAQVLDEIERFSTGWDTQIGEKGIRLSGGQKQRLALARIFLRSAPLVLFDDVLSAVDHETEARLIQAIHQVEGAAIIVSHRPSALKRCDRVLVFDEGKIRASGPFADVAVQCPELEWSEEGSHVKSC